MAQILYGEPVAAAINKDTAARIAALRARGVTPVLAIVRVGDDGADIAYERGAVRRCEALGAVARCVTLPGNVSQLDLDQTLRALSLDSRVHGILLFQPLPGHLDRATACAQIAAVKDVDGETVGSAASVYTNRGPGFTPCTAEAAMRLLKFYGISPAGQHVVIVGRSSVFGKPAAMRLLSEDATVSICHSRTRDLPALTRQADIILTATGKAGLIDAKYLREGQILIDIGMNVLEDGTLTGDINYAEAEPMAAAITPVPGGVGAVTTAVLLSHLVQAAEHCAD